MYIQEVGEGTCLKCVGIITQSTHACSVSFGSLKQSADYNFRLEFLIPPSSGRLKPNCDTHIVHFYIMLEQLQHGQKRSKNNNKYSLRNEKLKANNASETEEQRKERLRIRGKKNGARRRTKKLQEEKKRSSETEYHKKQRLVTLKRLKRGDKDGRRKKSKTGE